MKLTRVHPDPVESIEADAPAGRARLLELYRAEVGSLRLNMVTDVSGSAAGSDGTSESLTSRSDRKVLGVIRELSDVVLVGAASVRAEGYQLPRRSRLAVLTSSGDLSGHRLKGDGAGDVVVVCPESSADRALATLPGAEILPVATDGVRLSVRDAIAALRETGLTTIVCEGGPSLAAQLLNADLVDEVCLTTSPRFGGHPLDAFAGVERQAELALRQLIVDDAGFVFARWSTRGMPASV